MKAMNSWKNAAGQTVLETDVGLTVLPKNWTVQQWIANEEQRERGRVAAQAAESRTAEIKRALPADCVAVLNDVTGEVRVLAVPTPQFKLSDARRTLLEQQRDSLVRIADDPRSSPQARTNAKTELAHIEKLLRDDGESRPPSDQRPEADRRASRTDTGQR